MLSMKLATGTVVQGKVVLEGSSLPDGAVVTVLALAENESFDIPPELEAELDESIAQASRGEAIPVGEVLARLRAI